MKIANPINGYVESIEKASDPVFASKMLGNGFLVKPNSQILKAPIDGEVIMVYETKHAIGIKNDEVEILLHIGVDTVELGGQGFESYVVVGDHVKTGSELVKCDFEYIREQGYDESIMVIITNPKDIELNISAGIFDEGAIIIET